MNNIEKLKPYIEEYNDDFTNTVDEKVYYIEKRLKTVQYL